MIRILTGDALEVLRGLPAESVHTCVTSPPYWGLRDYGVPGQLGLEPTPEEHVARIVEVFREVRRVLRRDGTAWVNYGDCYAGSPSGFAGTDSAFGHSSSHRGGHQSGRRTIGGNGLKPKDLVGMPWRIAFALQADGWWLRSDVIWHKPNPMPESVSDRPTKAHEYVFLLARSARYFYDADAVREPTVSLDPDHSSYRPNSARIAEEGRKVSSAKHEASARSYSAAGRNLRSVWTITTCPFPEAHFATFPPALVEPCVKAGTSEKGCCATCGAPWERVVKAEASIATRKSYAAATAGAVANHRGTVKRPDGFYPDGPKTMGFGPTCAHGDDPVSCTVLDPFFGAGTVGLVADRLGRHAIGIELNPEYARMAENRIRRDAPLFAEIKTT